MLTTVYDHSTIKMMTTHTAEIISNMHNGDVVKEDGVIFCFVVPAVFLSILESTPKPCPNVLQLATPAKHIF